MSTGRRCSASATGCARAGMLAGIGIAACLEPSGGNSSFEPLLNPKNTTTTWMDSCRIMVDGLGHVTVTIHTTSSGQGHETLAATVVGEVLEIDPDRIRDRAPGFAHEPAEQFAGRQPHGGDARRRGVPCGGEAQAQALRRSRRISSASRRTTSTMRAARSIDRATGKRLEWIDLVTIAHRNFHLLPEGIEPGLEVTPRDAGADRRPRCRPPTAACRCIRATRSNSTSCWSRSIPISARPSCAAMSSAMTAAR